MIERTISGRIGDGDIRHTIRDFLTDNVDPDRVKDDIIVFNRNIKDVYSELFDEPLAEYNARQTRRDRKIKNYHEHIRHSRQEKEFHEAIFQIGNKDDTNCFMEEGKIATEILQKFTEEFEQRNPYLRVIAAAIHFDEHTPHLHIDFVPFVTEQKRGLSTRVSLRGALERQGFVGEGKLNTCAKLWVDSEKQRLSEMMLERGIEWKKLDTHLPHLSVSDFKKRERAKEVAALDREKEQKESEIAALEAKQREQETQAARLEKKIAEATDKVMRLDDINAVSYKENGLTGNVTMKRESFDTIMTLARKEVASEKSEKKLKSEITKLKSENNELKISLAKEKEINKTSKSVNLNVENIKLQKALDKMNDMWQKVVDFLVKIGLWDKFVKFIGGEERIKDMDITR